MFHHKEYDNSINSNKEERLLKNKEHMTPADRLREAVNKRNSTPIKATNVIIKGKQRGGGGFFDNSL